MALTIIKSMVSSQHLHFLHSFILGFYANMIACILTPIDKVFPSLHATRKVITGVLFGLDVKTLKAVPWPVDTWSGFLTHVSGIIKYTVLNQWTSTLSELKGITG